MPKKRIKIKNERKNFHKKIAEALTKKPTAGDLNKGRITSEQIGKLFGGEPPKSLRRTLNRKGSRYIDSRPKTTRGIVKLSPFIEPKSTKMALDPWFPSTEKQIDVSIIVPLYKSDVVIANQIASWDLVDDGLTKEIIYVDDFCPQGSYKKVIEAWNKRKTELNVPISVVRNDRNGGFGFACNAGANYAKGKYLLFLNADTTVTQNWIKPMYESIEKDSDIGIVGNLQLKSNGGIDSAGSQWDWSSMSFVHIGRNIYKNKPIQRFNIQNAPPDILEPKECDMVTGCCFIISKKLFITVGQFDLAYRIGYWEDSDLNMKVKALNKKIFYQPNSKIYHAVGHSAGGSFGVVSNNRDVFHNRWVKTERIDNYVHYPNHKRKNITIKDNVDNKVVGCVIACNEEEFLEASVESASPLVDRWYFVIGGNEYAYNAGMCNRTGHPNDSTLDIAHKLAEKYNGVVIEPPGRLWKDKVEMRNAYAQHINAGEWMFMLDGDEVYDANQLWRVTELMKNNEVLIMNFWLFWNNMNTLGTGSWGNYPQERVVKWKSGYGYSGKNHLHVTDSSKNTVCQKVPCYRGNEKLFYHYSWVRPIEKIRQKRDYYKYQSGNHNDRYVEDVFLKWRTDPESVNGKTHPMGGGGYASFEGLHPQNIQKMIDKNLLSF